MTETNKPFATGASVSRIFNDGSGELLAHFQYETDAKKWAQCKANASAKDKYPHAYYVACHYSGKIAQFTPEGKADD